MRPTSSPHPSPLAGPRSRRFAAGVRGSIVAAVALAAATTLPFALSGCASSAGSGPVDGASVYAARCGLCHPPWEPRDYLPSEWPALVDKFAARAGLNADERVAVRDWLVKEAAR